ncbi:MAG: glycosyltransferase [Anaerolineales bacterium]|nr:glycosyltransferase [Anaerolineales bacterium]
MPLRVLFIARYRDATMRRKVELLAAEPDLTVWHICPAHWQDELLDVRTQSGVVNGVPQTALPMLGRPTDPHRALYRTLTFGLRRFRPDLIHAEEEPESLAALQLALARRLFAPRARLVLNTWQNLARPTRWYVRAVRAQTLRAADAVLCANAEAAALLRQPGYPRPAPVLPAIGVDTRVFQPAAAPSERAAFVVGYAGRLAPEKGLDLLLAAVAQLPSAGPPVELRLMGGGPQRAELEAQAAALGLAGRVSFIAALPPSALAPALQALDALVLPSRTRPHWKEQFGRVLTEAMACGVPVVGSSSGAIPEVIGDAGLVFPEGDAPALAAALERLRADPAARAALAASGLARVRAHYTQDVIAARTAAFYRALPAGGSA